MGFNISDLKFLENVQNVNAKGIFTGDTNNINLKAVTSFERLSSVYSGRFFNKEDTGFGYLGKLEIKTPDFVSFMNNIGYKYNPKYLAANLFTFKADVSGNLQKFNIKNMDAFVGSNNFKGNISIENDKAHIINADITGNKFELDRFIPLVDGKTSKNIKKAITSDNLVTFIPKPEWSTSEINYGIYKDIELNGIFNFDHFSIGKTSFDNTSFKVNIKRGVIDFKEISVMYKQIPLKGELAFDTAKDASVKGHFESDEYNIAEFGGKKYEFLSGNASFVFDFESKASSAYDFVNALNGKLNFSIKDALIKGLNLKAIETDVTFRSKSDDLYDMLRKELSEGETEFYGINANLNFNNGEYVLENSDMKTSFAEIVISGKGKLSTWETNSVFTLTFNQFTDQIPPIDIKWSGTLNNPNIVINADKLKNKYDTFWEKAKEEQRAQEQAIQDALNKRMDNTQNKVNDIKEMIEIDIEPKLAKYEPMNSNITTKSRYDSISIQTQDIKNQLLDIIKAKEEPFDDEIITQMDARLEVFIPQIETMIRELDETYIIDLKNMSDLTYQKIKNIYDYSLKKGINYQNTLNAYVNRLIEIKSLVILDNEPKVADDKNRVETNLRTISDIHHKAIENSNLINNSNNIADLEMLYQVALELYEKSKGEMTNLNTEIKNLFEDARQIVAKEEDIALEKLEALKKVQEETILEQEKNKNLLGKDVKSKSKIVIIEAGNDTVKPEPQKMEEESKVEEQSVEETIKEMEDALFKEKVNNLNIDIENIEDIISQNTEIKPENPFAEAASVINEQVVPEQIMEPVIPAGENIIKTPEGAVVNTLSGIMETIDEPEVVEVVTPAEPLLKPTSKAAYRPKTIATGIIKKQSSSKRKNSGTEQSENTSLLRPITSGTVSSAGTITKNK